MSNELGELDRLRGESGQDSQNTAKKHLAGRTNGPPSRPPTFNGEAKPDVLLVEDQYLV